ncbi:MULTISPECIES: bifunctional folylpolyglutamate synthase/dihydrofolate synthase [unclassified Aureimonas]|uniref:bifunctional folylpolyglutamate synthase/dihydrofolate synthase n=1 Tax=unclassified Aureimonas TaxID=2615206 RepID=UPI0006F839F2|nr:MULTISPECIES: folylpolyglutamate synthase/dihydrofolate synthase family protein [unclassified Aureimonas]KQT64394.1 bifunctional folylpolyglutamate synthase/dihydrofolate synthase [Aureimonas sp. Leaf427]KQT81585.1 bifunctional folylpolyglutamate synthase/dihydrofolate synthase [Aureimonas sp. Leaf460]
MTATGQSLADAAIERLMLVHPKGFDLALDRIRRLLATLGDPQKRLSPTIHVAGTNGKGSVVAFCRAVLEADGKAVHAHTSPHLVNWHERYRLGRAGARGRLVEDEVLAEAVARVAEANAGQPITVFEILTAVTFVLFSEHPADAVLLEVGLGGRFDATNVIETPVASVITSISLDHQPYLGDRVELIAAEKAGIIKRGVPVVIGQQSQSIVIDVIKAAAKRAGAPVLLYGEDFFAYEEHGRMVYQDDQGLLDLAVPRLVGRHQIHNAATAVAALRQAGLDPSEAAVAKGIAGAEWPGRMQRITSGPLAAAAVKGSEIWLDGGHNPGAGAVIAEALAEMEDRVQRPLFIIAGMLNTKDPVGFFEAFAGMVRHVFTVPIRSSDAGADPDSLTDAAMEAGLDAEPCESVEEAIRLVSTGWQSQPAPRFLICGSLYLVGEVLAESGLAPT